MEEAAAKSIVTDMPSILRIPSLIYDVKCRRKNDSETAHLGFHQESEEFQYEKMKEKVTGELKRIFNPNSESRG